VEFTKLFDNNVELQLHLDSTNVELSSLRGDYIDAKERISKLEAELEDLVSLIERAIHFKDKECASF
jgi:hypothetical protein